MNGKVRRTLKTSQITIRGVLIFYANYLCKYGGVSKSPLDLKLCLCGLNSPAAHFMTMETVPVTSLAAFLSHLALDFDLRNDVRTPLFGAGAKKNKARVKWYG